MRIAYLAHVNGGSQSGVAHKLAGQLQRWRDRGHTARAFVVTRDAAAPWREQLGDAVVARYDGPVSRLRAMGAAVQAIRGFDADLVYLRWDLFYPAMLRLPADVPLVVELNTDDVSEYALGSPVRERYNRLTRRMALGRAQAFVFVTAELSALSSFRGFAASHHVITNGIDLGAYPQLPPPSGGVPRLVFVGTPGQPWQGVDKLLSLAGMRPDWRFEIVGEADPGLSHPNVEWHGSLDRSGVLNVLARADVGVGTLALHRKGMNEASPLKVREYLAVGLPVIHAYEDPDLAGLASYTVRLPNTDSNVIEGADRIDAFVRRVRGVRIPRSEVVHIDLDSKEEQRLALFEQIANR